MLHVVLAEAEIEPMPRELWKNPAIAAYAKKRGKPPGQCLLDSNLHHAAMRELPESERRGRPDIAHITLLCLLGSVVNHEGELRVYVHTRNDEVIHIKPETRLPRNYNRFVGLLEKLYRVQEDLFLRMEKLSVDGLVESIDPEWVVVMDDEGSPVSPKEFARRVRRDMCVIIGAFPHGGYKKSYGFHHERLSIYSKPLETWTVASEVACLYEYTLLRKL
jgi:rRNA small subunit pseudouridine methyltransferase Nep1